MSEQSCVPQPASTNNSYTILFHLYCYPISLHQTILMKISDFRTCPVVQWLRFCLPVQGVRVRSLIRELGSHMPHSQKIKIQNRSNIVTNSIKTLKSGPYYKKKIFKNLRHHFHKILVITLNYFNKVIIG